MSSIRLFILDSLEREGEMHGHQLRNLAEKEHVTMWTDISVGSLYGALKRLAVEGLIEVARTEQIGGYPERQIWRITTDGRISLQHLRATELREIVFRPDPLDLAFARFDRAHPDELLGITATRLAELRARLADAQTHLRRADPYLSPVEGRVLTHTITRLEAEIAWHEALVADLPALLEAEAAWKEHPHD